MRCFVMFVTAVCVLFLLNASKHFALISVVNLFKCKYVNSIKYFSFQKLMKYYFLLFAMVVV